jgi:signal transduction histidine kinase/CheY-like chemotaxis protein
MLLLSVLASVGANQGGLIHAANLHSIQRLNALYRLASAHEHYLKERAFALSRREGDEAPSVRKALQSLEEAQAHLARTASHTAASLYASTTPPHAEVEPLLYVPPGRQEEFSRLLQAALAQEELRTQAVNSQGMRLVETARLVAMAAPLVFMGVLLAAILAILGPFQRTLRGLRLGIERVGRGELHTELEVPRSSELGQIATAVNKMVADLRQTQGQLLTASRLTSMGELAASVAHEVNNPLAFVHSNLRFVRDELRREEPLAPEERQELREALEDSLKGAERISTIVQDLKLLARPEETQHAPVEVVEVLRAAARMTEHPLRNRARLVEQFEPIPLVEANTGRLGQVFLNLLLNAAQAIPPGHPEQHTVTLRTRLMPEGRVAVEIEDTGCGIPAEHLSRIFEPFFTTKGKEGTGLGLSVCHGILQSLGGDISVESTVGKGTLLRVQLPAAFQEEEEAPPPVALPSEHAPPSSSRVLVIDDEPDVGTAIRRVLGPGCDVTSITEPRHALAALCDGASYDAIICDVVMPEISGMELYAETAKRMPGREKRFIFITGGTFSPATLALLRGASIPVLPKPLDEDRLRAALRQCRA